VNTADRKFELRTSSRRNGITAVLAEGLEMTVTVIGLTDPRRLTRNEHAYAVLDINTGLVPIRVRDIKLVFSPNKKRLIVKWRKWKTGFRRGDCDEWLDIAGPPKQEDREALDEIIIAVYKQIVQESENGTLGQNNLDKLEELRASLEADSSDSAPAGDPDTEAEQSA